MSISVLSGSQQVLLLYPERNRVISACFVYTLKPEQLRDAVQELRTVRGGLAGWITPALEWTQADLAGVKNPIHARPDLLEIIPALLDSCRNLPVAEVWKRRRRVLQQRWAARLREHPEDMVEITAPWMLPDGYSLANAPGKTSASKESETASGKAVEDTPARKPRSKPKAAPVRPP